MNTKILGLLIVIGLLVSAMTVNAGNIGTAVINVATTLQEAVTYIARINITSPVDDNARYGQTNINIAYTTTNVSGSATKTYSLNGGLDTPLPASQFTVTGVDNGLTDGGQLNNITLNVTNEPNGTAGDIRFFRVDITAPRQIDNIANTRGINYINWTWVNPTNTDFNNTIVKVTNATSTVVPDTKLPKDINYFNATGLKPNTPYTISVKTEDNAPAPLP
jgi:hypothetical protein